MSNAPQSNGETAASESGRNPIDALADSFLARLRRGEYPAISEYEAKYPDLADEIRTVFPTLAMLEKGGEGLTAGEPAAPAERRLPRRLGEYHILREVGRGGMGIVYEAEHETMRRRVALKVLPPESATDSVSLQRFYLEARVAGRLHHTNIVPVFEVGTDQGHHYYAMQFIQGQSLDVVFGELRRIQGITPEMPQPSPRHESPTGAESELGKSIAINLMSGQFVPARPLAADAVPADQAEVTQATDVAVTSPFNGRTVENSRRTSTPSSRLAFADGPEHEATDTLRSVVSTELSNSTDTRDDYFRRVARIGLQIADALSYAHGQGILHRDIKPSNIILDAAGTAWVADFGLAKHEDDDLTRSGDILGTFRYMAPERFDGQTDARSDVYGLGLTLYELCTLRNAFRETDRARLVREVCEVAPRQPRRINPQIPADLETIILKSIEKQPGGRYQAARHVAEDLRLFLVDHPIRARRISGAERIWRWCRRNPQQAILAACVLLLLCIVTFGSLAFGYLTAAQAKELAQSKQTATERLYQSLRGSAEASRWSGRPGQHFNSLEYVTHAAEILPQLDGTPADLNKELFKLCNAAIAAMPLPDMRPVKTWQVQHPGTLQVVFNPTYSAYAQAERGGEIVVRAVDGETATSRLPAPTTETTVMRMQFSPDGRYLAVKYKSNDRYSLTVWDTASGETLVVPQVNLSANASFDFDADSAWIVLGNARTLTTYRLVDGKSLHESRLSAAAQSVRVSPATNHVAVLLTGSRKMQIWDTDSWKDQEVELETVVSAFDWQPRSGELVVGDYDGALRLLRLSEPPDEVREFKGHTSRIVAVHFSAAGDHLISQSWDGTTRLWNVATGELLLRMSGVHLLGSGFSRPDGRFIGMRDVSSRFEMWEVARETPLRVLQSPRSPARRWSIDIDPSGRWLASARDDGVELWDVRQGRLFDFLPATRLEDGTSKDAEFLPDGSGLLVSNSDGVRVYPMEFPGPSLPPRFLAPRTLHPRQASWVSLNEAGDMAAFRENMRGSLGIAVDLTDSTKTVKFGPHPGIDHVEICPDGLWVATTTWGGRGIHVWNTTTGERVTKQPLEPSEAKANVVFSPDGRRLAASTTRHFAAWRVGTWEEIYRIERQAEDEWPGPLVYSPDGKLLAAAHSRFVLALLDAASGEQISVLDSPSDAGFHACSFGPDGNILAAASDTDIHLWDVKKVRSQLAAIGLDFGGTRTGSDSHTRN